MCTHIIVCAYIKLLSHQVEQLPSHLPAFCNFDAKLWAWMAFELVYDSASLDIP